MADGQNANVGFNSYLAVGRELTFKTYNTCTAGLDFTSSKFMTKKDAKIIEAVSSSRTFKDRIGLSKSVEAELEFYIGADSDSSQYIMQNAFGGGTIATVTATGDTIGSAAFEHTYSLNQFAATYSSLCFNHRKGDSTNGKVFEYSGFRVNEFSLKADVDEALVASVKMVGVDSTSGGGDVSAALTGGSGQTPLVFTNMRFSVEGTFASLTASAFWHVQSLEWGINNNLKSDSGSRRLGSDLLTVLPPGTAAFTLKCTMRFDTLTAYSAMINETQFSAQMQFQGNTLTGSKIRQGIRIDHPRVYILDAGDPEIGGPDEVLTSDIEFMILQDDSSSTGYACKAVVTNATTSYA